MNERSKEQQDFNFRKLVPLLVIAIVAAIAFIAFRDNLSFDALRENRQVLIEFRDTNFLATSAAFVLAYVVMVAFSLPGATIATLTGGFLFGLFPGALYNVAAATVGAAIIFLAARMGLGDYLSGKIDSGSGRIRSIRDGLLENEISVLFLMRLVPAIPFFAANLVPALVGVKFRNFVFTTFFGIIPGTTIYTWVGVGLGDVLEVGGTPDFGIIWQWNILGPILGLCALAALPIVIKAIRSGK